MWWWVQRMAWLRASQMARLKVGPTAQPKAQSTGRLTARPRAQWTGQLMAPLMVQLRRSLVGKNGVMRASAAATACSADMPNSCHTQQAAPRLWPRSPGRMCTQQACCCSQWAAWAKMALAASGGSEEVGTVGTVVVVKIVVVLVAKASVAALWVAIVVVAAGSGAVPEDALAVSVVRETRAGVASGLEVVVAAEMVAAAKVVVVMVVAVVAVCSVTGGG